MTLVGAFNSFLTSVSFVLSCSDLSARVAPSDMPEKLRKPMVSVFFCQRASGDGVVIVTKDFGVALSRARLLSPPRLGTCCSSLAAGRTAAAGGRKRERKPATCGG